MKIELSSKPKAPTMILGFPGMGLVGPIVTEFLIEHMKTEQIGKFVYDELPPTAAIHKGGLIHPMSLHYSKTHHTLILYTILNVHGQEWEVSKEIEKLASELKVPEIICVDGASAMSEKEDQIFAFGSKKLVELGAQELKESVITGVTGALLLKAKNISCMFAGVQMDMPNAKAAAEIVKFLDKYLKLEVDYKPLLKQAELFEKKLTSVFEQSKRVLDEKEKRKMDYLG